VISLANKTSVTLKNNILQVREAIKNNVGITLEAIGEFLVVEAKKRVPVDKGTLKNSIFYRVIGRGRDPRVELVASAKHGTYVELGTGRYAEGGNGRKTPWVYKRADGAFVKTTGMKPQPFLRPAAYENAARITEIASRTFRRGL